MKIMIKRFFGYQLCWSLSLWLLCLMAMWLVLAQQSFFYSYWYQLLNINQTIIEYAPQNRFSRQNFVTTKAEEHERLFAQIVESIHQEGRGLSSIRYYLQDGQNFKLLTKDEIVHLQDVANLISLVKTYGGIVVIFFVLLSMMILRKSTIIASLKTQWIYAGVAIASMGIASLLIGVERVFYALHIFVFPENHPWFFYYQDSLMSTLMQAPNLFLPIAITWLVSTFIVWSAIIFIADWITLNLKH